VISRQTKGQLLAFLLISLIGLSYTGVRYAGLGKFFLDQGYLVSAEFSDSGGIFKGAEVTYRGVRVGKVDGLELVQDGVKLDLRLLPGTQVPTGATAVVANRSAVGEQYVDLQPTREGEPFLGAGAVIPRAQTAIPISPTELVVNLDDFVTSVNLEDLSVVIEELGLAFGNGGGESLQKLLDDGDSLTRAALDALPQTKALIRDGETVLNTQRDVSGQFKSYNADLAKLSETLRTSDPDFRRLFANGNDSANEVTDLIRKNRSDLPVLIQNLVTVAQIQKVRLPGLRQILVTYPNVVAGGFTVAPGDGTSHFGLVTESAPPPCRQGYEGTERRGALGPEGERTRTPNLEAGCSLPDGSPSSVRGAQRAPRPGEGGSRGTSAGSAAPSFDAQGSQDDEIGFGDYDPKTGRVITSEGERMTIGSTNGAERVFGKDSWQWLLLGPVSR
jgi:phospholipid/cholesterol/gamma-HCH transport system substrate-binding protein